MVEEILYPALEDFQLDLVIGEGPAARTVRIELQPFTLVGATTRLGLLTTPLRDRFGIPTRLEFYDVEELIQIVTRAARLLKADATPDGALEIARRARGTPRIAGRLLRRVADFALVEGDGKVTREVADRALTRLGVDDLGLDGADRRYLRLLAENYGGGPVGVETICGGAVGGARRDRGGDRAFPAAAGADPAHPAGADAGGEGVDAPRACGAAAGGADGGSFRRRVKAARRRTAAADVACCGREMGLVVRRGPSGEGGRAEEWTPMNRLSLAALLIAPIAISACAKQPAAPVAPVLTAAEQACVARGAEISAMDPATVTVTPTSSTKVGDTIYTVVANGIGYNCVVSPEGVVTSFTAQ